jgi:hypothetical protein
MERYCKKTLPATLNLVPSIGIMTQNPKGAETRGTFWKLRTPSPNSNVMVWSACPNLTKNILVQKVQVGWVRLGSVSFG